jgi:adenosylhomocysteine nucleosidase
MDVRMEASGEDPVTAVVAALPEELAPLRSRVTRVERRRAGSLLLEDGRLDGRRVVLAATGDGERNARVGVSALLAVTRAERLIVVGVAGALSRGLATAALVVASRVTDEGGWTVVGDEGQVGDVARATGGRLAVVLSAAAIADRADEKQRLARRLGAGDVPAVVDLESAAYVAGAVAAGVPWLVLRAVSDTADESLPELLNRSRDAGGAVSRGRVLLGLLRDPRSLPFLLALRGRVGRCAEVLAHAVAAALPALSRSGE